MIPIIRAPSQYGNSVASANHKSMPTSTTCEQYSEQDRTEIISGIPVLAETKPVFATFETATHGDV
jgi:hypothetical protein